MEELEDLRDSTFVNFATSVDKIQQALKIPKKRGVRGAKHGSGEAEQELKADMVTMITSPLSQLENPEPIPGLSAAQIEALRVLYAVVNDELRTDKDLETALEAAVKHLNPDFTPKIQEVEELDGDNDPTTGLLLMVRKSERLAQLPQKSYHEDADDDLEDLLEEEDEGDDEEVEEEDEGDDEEDLLEEEDEGDDEEVEEEDEGDDEEGPDQLDDEGNKEMDGVEITS